MGLDMYAYKTKERPRTEAGFELKAPMNAERIHAWRKHPDLHGWMEELYHEKGGAADIFNCERLMLSTDDLDALEAVIREGQLPETEGFFFGRSDGSEREDDLAFIEKARAAIKDGFTVYYDSWW